MANVLIFGATSAIAAEIAVSYAARGDRLHLVGRDPEKLSAVVQRCSAANTAAQAAITTSDVADLALVERSAALVQRAIEILGTIDVVLIAQGYLSDQLETEREYSAAEYSLRINFLGVVSLLIPLVNQLERQRSGRLAVITSVAGDRGRPRNYTYGTAKGALNLYLQGVRTRLYKFGVSVTTLRLGPVDTPMTRDHNKHFLFGTASGVARDIVRAIDARKAEVYSPFIWRFIMFGVRNTPEWLIQRLSFLSGR
jgi:short-subunit dehydrogenase